MRAKKLVLLADGDPDRLSIRAYLLETWGYRVWRASTAEMALGIVEMSEEYGEGEIRCLVTELALGPDADGDELARRAKQIRPGLPVMIVSGTGNSFERASHADMFLCKTACTPAEVLERVRILSTRKRGPRLGPKKLPVGAVRAIDAARRRA